MTTQSPFAYSVLDSWFIAVVARSCTAGGIASAVWFHSHNWPRATRSLPSRSSDRTRARAGGAAPIIGRSG